MSEFPSNYLMSHIDINTIAKARIYFPTFSTDPMCLWKNTFPFGVKSNMLVEGSWKQDPTNL